MKTYYMKIRDKYIKEVRDGVKKHEYRLASPDRKAVRVGDNIILISNTDKKSYVRTTVKRITTYRDWKEALEKNWQNDFKRNAEYAALGANENYQSGKSYKNA